jgi:hypothetical protein
MFNEILKSIALQANGIPSEIEYDDQGNGVIKVKTTVSAPRTFNGTAEEFSQLPPEQQDKFIKMQEHIDNYNIRNRNIPGEEGEFKRLQEEAMSVFTGMAEQTPPPDIRTFPGLVAGATSATLGAPADIAGLVGGGLYGIYKAAFPNEDETRLQSAASGFANVLGTVSETAGSMAARNLFDSWLNTIPLDEETKGKISEGADLGEWFGIPGAGTAVAVGKKSVMKGVKELGDFVAGAPDRIAARQADTAVQLNAGVDVPAAIDEAIVGVKNLINKTDEAKAAYNASPNDPALRKKYLDLRRQRDEQMSALPDDAELKVEADYRMQHQPRNVEEGGARLDDITGGGQVFPDDVYSSKGFEYYGDSTSEANLESYNIIKSVRNKPDEEITIYRAVPKGVTDINEGDWVTLSQKYAQDHAESGYGADGKEAGEVISKVVKVRDVVNDGNDFNEFGYFPETNPTIVGAQRVFQKPTKENPITAVAPTETEPGIIAFHGSGADFDEFKLEKIGTGIGYQNYGNGLYFSDSIKVAESYKKEPGKVFMVKLGVKEKNLLDWQKPLKEQPVMLNKIRSLIDDEDILQTFDYNVNAGIAAGNAYVNYISGSGQKTSELLKSVGIEGIKYLDIGSRAGGKSISDAPTNYVIFNDKAIKILNKYGIVGPVAITGVAANQQGGSETSETM